MAENEMESTSNLRTSESNSDLLKAPPQNRLLNINSSKIKSKLYFLLFNNKKGVIMITSFSIFSVWIIFLFPIIGIVIYSSATNLAPVRPINNLISDNMSLPLELNCTQEFIYSRANRGCYPPCGWHPNGVTDRLLIRIMYKVVCIVSFAIGVVIFSIWITTSFFDFRECKRIKLNLKELNPARISIYMVIIHAILLSAYGIVLSFFDNSILFCYTNEIGQTYLPGPSVYYNQTHDVQIIVTILGVLGHWLLIAFNMWVINAFIYILRIVFSPLSPLKSLKAVFCVIFTHIYTILVCFVFIGLGFVINYRSPIDTYGVSLIFYTIQPLKFVPVLLLYYFPYILTCTIIPTLGLIIIAKLRIEAINISNSISPEHQKLTPLEKGLIIYGHTLILFLAIAAFSNVAAFFYLEDYSDALMSYLTCITNNSLTLSSTLRYPSLNKTYNVAIVNTSMLQNCQVYGDEVSHVYPTWYLLSSNFVCTIIPTLFYLVVIPNSLLRTLFSCRKFRSANKTHHTSGTVAGVNLPLHTRPLKFNNEKKI